MKTAKGLNVFFMLFLCTLFLQLFSYAGVFAYEALWKVRDVYPKGTAVANVSIADLDKQTAYDKVQAAIKQWQEGEAIPFLYYEQELFISRQAFVFNEENTFADIVPGKQIPASVTIDEDLLYQELSNLTMEQWKQIDKKRLQQELQALASMLQENEEPISLVSYINNEKANKITVIAEAKNVIPGDIQEDVISWLEHKSQLFILSKETFSFINTLNEIDSLSNSGASFIASTLYEAILYTNFHIVDRAISQTKPPAIPLGYEAKIVQNEVDFRFHNPNPHAYEIVSKIENNELVIEIVGKPFPYAYQVQFKEEQQYEPKTIVQYSGQLLPGEQMIKEEGQKGVSAAVYREAKDEHGKVVESRLMSKDFYTPVHRIEVYPYASAPKEEEEKKEENTTENIENSPYNEEAGIQAENE